MPSLGDYVTITDRDLTWQIVAIRGDEAELRSGLSGRRRLEPVRNLTLFQKGNA